MTKRSNRTPFITVIVTIAILKCGASVLAFSANNPREIGSNSSYKPKTLRIASSAPIVLNRALDHVGIPVEILLHSDVGTRSPSRFDADFRGHDRSRLRARGSRLEDKKMRGRKQ